MKLQSKQYWYLRTILDIDDVHDFVISSSARREIEKVIKDGNYSQSQRRWLNQLKKIYIKYK